MSAHTFTLSSPDLGGQGTVTQEFSGFGCTGQNRSPHLQWHHAPAGTKSFALTLYDPDAPTGSGWWHWLVFDLPAHITEIPSGAGDPANGSMPSPAIQSLTDYGVVGYGGPCPPQGHGFHQYIITLYALDTESLGLSAQTNPAVVGFTIGAHTLAKASLVFYYKR